MCFSLELKKLLSATLLDGSGTGSTHEEASDASPLQAPCTALLDSAKSLHLDFQLHSWADISISLPPNPMIKLSCPSSIAIPVSVFAYPIHVEITSHKILLIAKEPCVFSIALGCNFCAK
ncbi:hypothetical protein NC651_012996 [Populus alba x Populus x berolinensis]|nr:hypothetical protein NC651_012996 [Populus alba x Populus x berolinensis]